ncbi:hypothetical protein GOP47_0014898 [Adiantum capillus-veneris]|uniref:Srp40 C-terminal domain-containing protein n=1 Tax=Adiantum capillus-veneris TaxID=13818 RepID=A0A9D4ZEP0_ADICA|nr:hypothetical protein GOP47_0014898 [Adiantum capillus-veneris]
MPSAATTSHSMAVEHASDLASIVAFYLRKHGFRKTLSAFLRENGDASQEADVADLETLYKLYLSTQADEPSKAKKSRTTKSENGPPSLDKDVRDDGENEPASPHTNGGISSEKKKKKKGDKKNASVDLPVSDQTGKHADPAEAKKNTKEECSKKKKGGENIEVKHTKIEGLKSECEKVFSNGNAAQSDSTFKENVMENHDADGGCLVILQELPHSRKSSSKKSKKEKKEQERVLLQHKETSEQQSLLLQSKDISAATKSKPADNLQVSPHNDEKPKKKRKTSEDSSSKDGKEDAAVAKSASEILSSENISNQLINASKRLTKSVHEFEGGEIKAKKKKHRKEVSLQCAEGGLKEPSKSELEEDQNEDTDNTKRHGKKRKVKEYVNAGKNSKQDSSNSGSSPEKLKEFEGVADKDVETDDFVGVKAKKKIDTPNDKRTPTGALAFKRVEVEKVTFSDPRLRDNSYWAKDGAEKGYGAKAQEVLGQVRGRDFRHEKTKKKRVVKQIGGGQMSKDGLLRLQDARVELQELHNELKLVF